MSLGDDKLATTSQTVCARMTEFAITDPGTYLSLIAADEGEIAVLSGRLTAGETCFFRDKDHWRAFDEHVLPSILEQNRARGRRHIRIWSAACSTGEEAYTIGVALQLRAAGLGDHTIRVIGTDINRDAIAKARRAVYTGNSFRDVEPETVARFFEQVGPGAYRPRDALRSSVEFRTLNLLAPEEVESVGDCDIIFCRNLLISFDQPTARSVLDSLSRRLRPGGFLLLGHAEDMLGAECGLDREEVCGTFVYRRASGTSDDRGPADRDAARARPAGANSFAPVATAATQDGLEPASTTSHLACGVIEIPSLPGTPAAGDDGAAQVLSTCLDNAPETQIESAEALSRRAVECLCRGREAEARALLERLLAREPSHLEARLGMALLLAGGGDCEAALRYCDSVVRDEPLSAEARCVTALVHESLGSYDVARREMEKAIYLDGGFSVAYFRLALLHERSGADEAGRRALQGALRALPGDDEHRVRLYSGGYGKESVTSICQRRLAEHAPVATTPAVFGR